MNEHLAWQLAITRPLIMLAAVVLAGLLLNGVAGVWKKDAAQYQSKAWWSVVFVLLAGGHIAAFMHHHDFPDWALNAAWGFWVGIMSTGLLYIGAYHFLHVKLVRAYTLLASVLFAVVANATPLENMMIEWIKKL